MKAVLLAAAMTMWSVVASAQPPVSVYVTTAATKDGFTDPDKAKQDSMKDLLEALGKKKNIHLTAAREEAVIVLEVIGRGVREDSGTYTKVFGGKNEVKKLQAKLSVGGFSAELSGESAGGGMSGGPARGAWKKAAYKLADQVEKWVKENQAQLQKPRLPEPRDRFLPRM